MKRDVKLERGQSLVLMALTMLLLFLMVMLTLSFGWRVRDRIESQVTADAAAYNQAVVTARTFNEMALYNRTIIALTVSTLGMESLMNWTAHYRANLQGLIDSLEMIEAEYEAECSPFFPCPCFQIPVVAGAISAVQQEQQRVQQEWDGVEQPAAQQAQTAWMAAADTINVAKSNAFDQALMQGLITNQAYTSLTVQSVYPNGAPTPTAPGQGDKKSTDEINNAFRIADGDDLLSDAIPVMGTRGFAFVHSRAGGYQPIKTKLDSLIQPFQAGASTTPAAGVGGTSIGNNRHANTVPTIELTKDDYAWAEDHGGSLETMWPAPVCPAAGTGGVTDTSLGGGASGANFHVFSASKGGPAVDQRSDPHTLSGSGHFWVKFPEFNFHEMNNPGNDFGQPTLYSMVERDYSLTPKRPWDLNFNFQFQKDQAGTRFNDNSPQGSFTSFDGASLQKQVAIGSSIVYYHRPEAWAEPPNMFNPFWRATLVSANVDLPQYLQKAGYNEHSQSMQKLAGAGWRGMR